MKIRTTLALTASAAALAGAGLLAVPATADSAAMHTLHFRTTTIAQRMVNASFSAGVDRDNAVGGQHRFVAYDALTFRSASTADVALARPRGFIYAHLAFGKDGKFTGTVTGGTGRYAGSSGTVTGVPVSAKHSVVTVKYHH